MKQTLVKVVMRPGLMPDETYEACDNVRLDLEDLARRAEITV